MKSKLENEIQEWLSFVGPKVDQSFDIVELLRDDSHVHRHQAGYWHLYTFWLYDNSCLKIGLAGPKSAARYNSQHYNPRSANSNLAKCLLREDRCSEPAKPWIIENTYRINAVFSGFTVPLAHALETYLHLIFEPRFER